MVLNIVCEDCTIHFISGSVLLSEQCWYQGGSDRGGVISWPAPGSTTQWRLILQYNTFSILCWNLSLIGPASPLHSQALYQCRDHVRSDNHRYVNQATTVCVKIVLPSINGEVYFFVLDFGVKIAVLH